VSREAARASIIETSHGLRTGAFCYWLSVFFAARVSLEKASAAAAAGVEGPGRTPSGVAKRVAQPEGPKGEHDRRYNDARRKEQPLESTGGR